MNKSLTAGSCCWPDTSNDSRAFLRWTFAPAAAESLLYLNWCSFWCRYFAWAEWFKSDEVILVQLKCLLVHIRNTCWCCWLSVTFHWGIFPFIGKDLNDETIQLEAVEWVKITSHANTSEILRTGLKLSCVEDAVLLVVIRSLLQNVPCFGQWPGAELHSDSFAFL